MIWRPRGFDCVRHAGALRAARLPSRLAALLLALVAPCADAAPGPLLKKQELLDAQTFWDNRDWNWYKANIPFFECPDPEINTTYYYRWELVTKHLTYGSPATGYTFTEFIDRPSWSGAYGAISCSAGHQLYEVRWLRDPRAARDFARYWFRTPGAQPRNYSTWLADAVWALHQVHPDDGFVIGMLPDLKHNYQEWERAHFVPAVGLFWQTGHDDGMEFNINSRQTRDILRGAPGFRPTLNSYLWADALAIALVSELAGDPQAARLYREKAASLKEKLLEKLWDPERHFFFPMATRDEARDGHTVKAGSLTYQTGRFAGSPHGRELIGYVPWQFNLPDAGRGYESAWKFLMDRDYFFADFGPSTVERHDPMFLLRTSCCWWSGQSWPYATTQTLKAMAKLIQDQDQHIVTRADYARLLRVYALSHRKEGRPYLAEACHPDTGSFEGHDHYNHSEHYFHSGFCDLIITGLVGLKPRDDDTVEVQPLAPEDWDYFALDDLVYHGRRLSIVWDRMGTRYGLGKGLHIVADGTTIATATGLKRLTANLPNAGEDRSRAANQPAKTLVNYAVNNDGDYFPRVSASSVGEGASTATLIDGNYWYHPHPPNRWTSEKSPDGRDSVVIDFGIARRMHAVKLYVLDDGDSIVAPIGIDLDDWHNGAWRPVPDQTRYPVRPTGRRANVIRFPEREIAKFRVTLTHVGGARSGLTEIEAWGETELPVPPAPPPAGNLAFNRGDQPFPRASASHTSRFDKVEMVNDGRVVFTPSPHNRWTSYGSRSDTDWLEIDFGTPRSFRRVELALYDDRGGVQPPSAYDIQFWDGSDWRDVIQPRKSPARPIGGVINTVSFDRCSATKLRIVFTHRSKARSGVSEIMVWSE